MLQTGDGLPDTPTRIYLLDDRDFNQYAAFRPGLGGFFQEGRFQNLMVVNAAKPFDIVRVALLHEFVHYIQRSTSTQRLPPWFMEGYAELFSGFQLKDKKMLVGGLPSGVGLNWMYWIPVERLLSIKQTDPEYQNERLAECLQSSHPRKPRAGGAALGAAAGGLGAAPGYADAVLALEKIRPGFPVCHAAQDCKMPLFGEPLCPQCGQPLSANVRHSSS